MFDIAQWALGMDESGPIEFNPPAQHAVIGLQMKYKNGVILNHANWGAQCEGVQFVGTKGKIEVSRDYLRSDPAQIVGGASGVASIGQRVSSLLAEEIQPAPRQYAVVKHARLGRVHACALTLMVIIMTG